MNRIIRASYCIPFGLLKIVCLKIFHLKDFSAPLIGIISPLTEITLEHGAKLSIGKLFKMRDGAKIRVRRGAVCILGNNVSINSFNIIVCRERIEIGNDVQLGPNVFIYDHDHDFRAQGGLKAMKYKTGAVYIGNNVWIGANSVILRGTRIGDNSVVGAGSVLKGTYQPNSIIIQKRNEYVR